MSARDWGQDSLTKYWLSESKKNGDLYRQLLVNPIIHELLSATETRSFMPLSDALCRWYERHAKDLTVEESGARGWYAEWRPSMRYSILDLGCGDAYRGRWLVQSPNVTYVGVDVSGKLLAASGHANRFEVAELDLDIEPNKVPGLWRQARPPEWVFMITLLDHLKRPEDLLLALANMYTLGDVGRFLVVTCNSRFYRTDASPSEERRVRIAAISSEANDVGVYFRSRTDCRRLFRDAGLQVIDEFCPALPKCAADLRTHSADGLDLSVGPLHFWLLQAHSTRRTPLADGELEGWAEEVSEGEPLSHRATRQALTALTSLTERPYWRHLPLNAPLLSELNLGGRLFIVRTGELQTKLPSGNVGKDDEAPAEISFRFRPNDYLGELELSLPGEEPERLYSHNVVVSRSGPGADGAKVLEIPSRIVQRLLVDPSGFGNPHFAVLRRKILRTLFAPRGTHKEQFVGHEPVGTNGRLAKRHVRLAATLLVRALEADRDNGAYDPSLRRVVCIGSMAAAVELFDLRGQSLMNALNKAFEFLQQVGAVWLFRTQHNPAVESAYQDALKVFNRRPAEGPKPPATPDEGVVRVRRRMDLEEYFRAVAVNSQKAQVYSTFFKSPAYRMFLVDDEVLLKRCATEPSEGFYEGLKARHRLYSNPDHDAVIAQFEAMCEASLLHLRLRFERHDLWRHDSLGLPLLTPNSRHTGPVARFSK